MVARRRSRVLPLAARRDKNGGTQKGYNINSVSDAAISRDVSPRWLRARRARWLENTRRRDTWRDELSASYASRRETAQSRCDNALSFSPGAGNVDLFMTRL